MYFYKVWLFIFKLWIFTFGFTYKFYTFNIFDKSIILLVITVYFNKINNYFNIRLEVKQMSKNSELIANYTINQILISVWDGVANSIISKKLALQSAHL